MLGKLLHCFGAANSDFGIPMTHCLGQRLDEICSQCCRSGGICGAISYVYSWKNEEFLPLVANLASIAAPATFISSEPASILWNDVKSGSTSVIACLPLSYSIDKIRNGRQSYRKSINIRVNAMNSRRAKKDVFLGSWLTLSISTFTAE